MKKPTSILHQTKMDGREPIGVDPIRDDDAALVAVHLNFSGDLLPVCYWSHIYELELIRKPYPLRYLVNVFAEDNQMLLIVEASCDHRTTGFPLLDHCSHAPSRLVAASKHFYHDTATTRNASQPLHSDDMQTRSTA